jgi:hypothetical protein
VTSRTHALLGLLPPALAALAEGAWVAVLAALVAALDHDNAKLGPAGFAIAAVAGLVAADRFGRRDDWPNLTVALTAAAGVVGWLCDPSALAALGRLDLADAVAHHPAGWLAALAFLRGSAHARPTSSQGAMETLLTVALPGLAVPLLLGGLLHEPGRGQFLGDARVAVVLFLAAATAGVAVARLAALRGPAGFDWRRNRAWLALLVVLVLGVSLIALPIAALLGPLVQVAIALLFLPALVLGTIAGFRYVSRWAVLIYGVIWLAVVLALRIAGGIQASPSNPAEGANGLNDQASDSTVVYVVGALVVLAILVLGVIALARLWSRDVLRGRDDDVDEERWIDASEPAPADGAAEPRATRRRRGGEPSGAADAYLDVLASFERSDSVRRLPAESPAEHAARLRASGTSGSPGLALDLLAADYELVTFARVHLSEREERRAISRWRRLRRA